MAVNKTRIIKKEIFEIIEGTTILPNFNRYKGYDLSVAKLEEMQEKIEEINNNKDN